MSTVYFIASLVALVFAISLMISVMPRFLIKKSKSTFGFDETVERIMAAVEERGWSVYNIHDLQENLHKNGFSVKRTVVVVIGNATVAYEILRVESARSISALMPCRIAVYEGAKQEVMVSWMDVSRTGSLLAGVRRRAIKNAAKENEQIICAAIGYEKLNKLLIVEDSCQTSN
jgi:uncharacterized protein (DUF302 family)